MRKCARCGSNLFPALGQCVREQLAVQFALCGESGRQPEPRFEGFVVRDAPLCAGVSHGGMAEELVGGAGRHGQGLLEVARGAVEGFGAGIGCSS